MTTIMAELGLLFFLVSIIMIITGVMTLSAGAIFDKENVKSIGLKLLTGGGIGLIGGFTLCTMTLN